MHNLGLIDAIIEVIVKISKCPMCCCFWVTLIVTIYFGYNVIVSTMLSIAMAYISNYIGIVLLLFNRLYEYLWQRANQRKRKQTKIKKRL